MIERRAGHVIDMKELKKTCDRFHDAMRDNRPNTNDGQIALTLYSEIERYGVPNTRTAKKMLAWCHTDGSVYQAGVPFAQKIALALYGRIPTKAEIA